MEDEFRKFEVGQRVIFIEMEDPDYGVFKGQEGVVCRANETKFSSVGVRWDKWHPDYHECGGNCDNNHGWNVPARMLEPLVESLDLDITADDMSRFLGGST